MTPSDTSSIPSVSHQELIRDGLTYRMGPNEYFPWRRVLLGIIRYVAACFIAGMGFQAWKDWNETTAAISAQKGEDEKAVKEWEYRRDSLKWNRARK